MLKRLFLSSVALAISAGLAFADCGVNVVPAPGLNCGYVPKQTYAAVSVALVAAATPTDLFCITGSASKTIRVNDIRMSGTVTTAVNVPVTVLLRQIADTGGTAASTTANPANTIGKMDSTFGAATATLISYTANPTINDTSPTYLRTQTLPLVAATGAVPPLPFDFSLYSGVNAQIPTLRGAAQQLCVNLNATSVTLTGNSIQMDIQWTEE